MVSRPLHVCHVFSTFATGGPQVRTAQIINSAGGSMRHTIVAADDRYEAAKYIDDSAPAMYRHPPRGQGGYLWAIALARTLADIAPDVAVTYNWGAMDAVVGAQLGPRCPIIHTEDGFGPDEAVRRKRRRILFRRLALRRVQAVVVPSRTLAAIAHDEYRLPSEQIVYIPNGVDVARFRPGAHPSWRRACGIPDTAVVFGTVGRLRREKNLDLLFEAFRRADVSNGWLAIVGDGERRAEWEAIARRLGLADRVVFAGDVIDPAPIYRGFDVFVMSSATEQMPMALLEAMASGLPAVCTDVGDTREILGSRAPQIVPLDADQYAASLAILARDAGLRRSLGAANRARVTACYSADRMVEQYHSLYEAVAARRRGGPRMVSLKRAAYASGVLGAAHKWQNRRLLTVVMFHRVLDRADPRWTTADPLYTVSPALFEQCLAFFRTHYQPVDLASVVEARHGRAVLPPRALLITFDDGWADNEEYALPALRRHGLPAVVFVVAQAVNRRQPFWQDSLFAAWRTGRLTADRAGTLRRPAHAGMPMPIDEGELVALVEDLESRDGADVEKALLSDEPAPAAMLSADQLLRLRAGGVAIGAHGLTHRPLPRSADQRAELETSRELLRDAMKSVAPAAPVALSFPHGRYDDTTIAAARSAGFEVMFTSDACLNELTPDGRCSDLLGRIEIPAHAVADGNGDLRPELLALWLFRRPRRRLDASDAGRLAERPPRQS